MAEIHAIVNGNWNSTSTWDLNRLPDVDDEVYLDGFTIQGYSNMLISVKSINNVSYGGHINITSGGVCIFNCDFAIGNVNMITSTYCELQVNGNVHIFGVGLLQNNTTGARPFTVNGNVTIDSTSLLYGGQKGAIVINGNFNAPNSSIPTAYGQNSTVINGNVVVNYITNVTAGSGFLSVGGDLTIKQTSVNNNISVSGTLFIEEDASLSITTLTIGGGIYYFNRNSDNLNLNAGSINPTANFFATNLFKVPDYPNVNNVKIGIIYGHGVYTGTYDIENLLPPESVVLKDYEYGDSDDRKTGTMEQEVNVEVGCVTPEDVRKDVPLVGMGVVGSLVVPSVDDVREGVVFDNGSVGTLIVQGGGDRLRIADFGYYTNAQSDTYIVDLTEQDKPKFAVAEERVLIEMFPELDLENIPDKYFDDLFVKYLKYRLIVEYYRTAGINSTFTPSEPTTEIVNYQNVRNEVWLNSANIYLKAWAKKYPESIVKPQRILL